MGQRGPSEAGMGLVAALRRGFHDVSNSNHVVSGGGEGLLDLVPYRVRIAAQRLIPRGSY
jgi:hypothetical protein